MGPRLKLPKFVHGYLDRHGRSRHYLRRRGRMQVSLPGMPWSEQFMLAYAAALNDSLPVTIGIRQTKPGTVEEAVARYFGSGAFAVLAPSTQAMRRAILERFRVEHGDKRIGKLRAEHVARMVGKLRPYAQRNMMKTLRGLMAFSVTDRLIAADPTVGVKLGRAKDTGGFATWSLECIEQYRAVHKLGTRARLALELLYGTMQRRGDIVRLGRQHVQNSVLSLRQQKTGTDVDIPILPELQVAIDAMPKGGHLTFLVTEHGKPFSAAGFGNWFRDMCEQAGIPKKLSAHGLRKAGATRLAEHECTDHQIMAWGGWKTLSEVQRYTREANRKRLARQAADKLETGTRVANLFAKVSQNGGKAVEDQ
jgi:integrase